MRVVFIVSLLLYALSGQAYSDLAPFAAHCSYKQPQNNQLINSHDFRVVKNSMRLHREHKKQKAQGKQLSKYAVHQALEYYLKNNHDTYNPQERFNALSQTRSTGGKRTKRVIPVNEKIYAYAREYDIPKSAFAQRTMNAYEYQLHKEFVEQLTQAQQLKPLYNQAREHTVFLDMVGHSVALGMEANQHNHAATATYWCDIAWKSLDLAQAVGEGVALGVYNTAAFVGNVIRHPVETIQVVGHGVASVVTMLAHATGTVLRFQALEERGYHEQLDAELNDLVDQINGVIDRCSDQIAQMPLREKVKHATAFGTELIIPGKAFKVIHNICSRMKPLAIGLFHALRDEQKAVQIAARVEGVAESIGMRVVEGAQEAAGAAKVVLSEAQLLLQSFHVDLMRKLAPEIAALRVLFDNRVKGFGEFASKYLKFDYEHIFGMELSFSKRGVPQIGGFHHDLMSAVKKSNIFEFVDEVLHGSGFYKAKLFHKGDFVKEITFFPTHWSREKVISNIYEAYQNFFIDGGVPELTQGGKYLIKAYTKEGIRLDMFITKKGIIKTVYPKL